MTRQSKHTVETYTSRNCNLFLPVPILPLSKERTKRIITVVIHAANALIMLAFNKRASRLMVHFWLRRFEPSAFCRCVEVLCDALPVGHDFTIIGPSPVANAPPHILRQRN
jgi:hypothetical protein